MGWPNSWAGKRLWAPSSVTWVWSPEPTWWQKITSSPKLSSDLHVYITMYLVLVRVATALMKHHDQNKLKRKRFVQLLLPHHCPSSKEIRAGTWRQELMQRQRRRASFWLALYGVLSQTSYTCQGTYPGVPASTMGWAFTHHQSRKSTTLLWEYYLNWISAFLKDTKLGQVGIRLASTHIISYQRILPEVQEWILTDFWKNETM